MKNDIRTYINGLLTGLVVAFSPAYALAEKEPYPPEENAFERGFERGFEQGAKTHRPASPRSWWTATSVSVALETTRYAPRDWDDAWGIAIGIYQDQERAPHHPSSKLAPPLGFAGLRVGWVPFEGSHRERVTIHGIQTQTMDVGFELKSDAYFLQFLGTGTYPLNDAVRIPARFGWGFTWFDVKDMDRITIDGVDMTDAYDFDNDLLFDFHWIIGVGLEITHPETPFAIGALLGYRWTMWELWRYKLTYRDPRTGRTRTTREQGAELLGGVARGMTVDAYLRYSF